MWETKVVHSLRPDQMHGVLLPYQQLIEKFDAEFGWENAGKTRLLSLSRAIQQALVEAGVPRSQIEDLHLSTVRENDRFFSHRAENGKTGRHAALAYMVE